MKSSRRHDLKHDQLADTLGTLWEYIVLHRVKVVLIAAGVLAVVGLVSWIYAVGAMTRTTAEELLAETQETLWRIEALRRQDPEQALMLSGRIISDLREIAQQYPATPAAAQALFKAGRLLMEEGQYDRAATAFREVIADTRNRPVLRQMGRRNLAAALEQAGEPEKAVEEYWLLAEEAESALARAQGYWDMGRCYEEMNDVPRALEAYSEAVQAAPDSAWAELSLSRSRALSVRRRPPPAPDPVPAPPDDEALTTDAPDDIKTQMETEEAEP